jgi:hypothetical protein
VSDGGTGVGDASPAVALVLQRKKKVMMKMSLLILRKRAWI